MNTNYDLRKALYNFLDIKFNTNEITIDDGNKFKLARVEANSIINLFISTSSGGLYLNAFGENHVNEYYSNIKVKVYWDENIIYIQNDTSSSININSVYIEFLKGKLMETFMSSSGSSLSGAKITIDNTIVDRVNFKDKSLTFKSEYDSLVNNLNSFNSNFNIWKNTLGSFSTINQLTSSNIETYMSPASIPSTRLIDGSILRVKLNTEVTNSLDLADTAIQNITLNSGSNLKDINKNVNINSLVKLRIQDFNNDIIRTYDVNSSGEILVNNWNEYIQPKLLGSTNDLIYFNGDNTIHNISKDLFLLKSDIKSDFTNADDTTIPSSLLVKNSLDAKVNKINRTALNDLSMIKLTINEQGQITSNETVSQSDLTSVIGNYYLQTSYEWNSNTGVLKLL